MFPLLKIDICCGRVSIDETNVYDADHTKATSKQGVSQILGMVCIYIW